MMHSSDMVNRLSLHNSFLHFSNQKIRSSGHFLAFKTCLWLLPGCWEADLIRTWLAEAMTDVITATAVGKVPCRFDVDNVVWLSRVSMQPHACNADFLSLWLWRNLFLGSQSWEAENTNSSAGWNFARGDRSGAEFEAKILGSIYFLDLWISEEMDVLDVFPVTDLPLRFFPLEKGKWVSWWEHG